MILTFIHFKYRIVIKTLALLSKNNLNERCMRLKLLFTLLRYKRTNITCIVPLFTSNVYIFIIFYINEYIASNHFIYF